MSRYSLLLFAIMFLASACVAINGGNLREVENESLGKVRRKISINFSNYSVIRDIKGRERRGEAKLIVEGHMLGDSNFFLTTQSLNGEQDLHLRFRTVTLESDVALWKKIANALYFGASMMTLTAIPYYHRVKRRLEVEVIRHNRVLKRYSYRDYFVLFSWLFAAPFWRISDYGDYWYGKTEVENEVDTNLVRHFLLDLRKDFFYAAKKH